MTSCVIYCRQSLDRTGREAAVERQQTECRALADRLGLTVEHVYVDNDVSAFSGKRRPGFEALLKSGADAIVVWHLDRLVRRARDLEPVIDLDVNIYAVSSGMADLSNPQGRLAARIGVSVAQYESEQKGERQKSMHRQRRAEGRVWWHARRPLGFETDGATRSAEMVVVRDLYRRALHGESMAVMATWSGLSDSGVRELLMNERNRPYVGDDTWDAVNAMLRARRTGYRHGAGMLTGLAVCGVCGAPCKVATGGGKRGVSVYKCRPAGHVSYPRAELDLWVGTRVAGVLSEAREMIEEKPEDSSAELAALSSDFVSGRMTLESFTGAAERIKQRAAKPAAPWVPWAQLSEPERRQLCRIVLEAVTIPSRGKGAHRLFPPQDGWLRWRTRS